MHPNEKVLRGADEAQMQGDLLTSWPGGLPT